MINITLIGNLGREPETRTLDSGKTVCNFSVAVTRKVRGEDVTEWVRVSAFDKLGENCQKYLAKGRKAYVSGTPTARCYKNKSDEWVAQMEVIARDVEFLTPKGEAGQSAVPDQPKSDVNGFVEVEDEELPF